MLGAGRVGTALGVLLERAGHRVVLAAGREASRERAARWLPRTPFVDLAGFGGDAVTEARLVLVCVPDDAIESVCTLASPGLRAGQHVAHVSGALGLDVLGTARAAGAAVLSLHPLQSFPDVQTGVARLPGSGIAVTADDPTTVRFGERVARDVGGRPFRVEEAAKPLYHAAAVFAANSLVTVEATAERLFRAAGVEDPAPLFEPLARANLDAAFDTGPERAITGPAARGDVGTIRRNAAALAEHAPGALRAYVELAALAAVLAESAGRLDAGGHARVEEELDRWR